LSAIDRTVGPSIRWAGPRALVGAWGPLIGARSCRSATLGCWSVRARERHSEAGPAAAIRWRSISTVAARPASSFLSGPHRRVATTKTSQRFAEARSTA